MKKLFLGVEQTGATHLALLMTAKARILMSNGDDELQLATNILKGPLSLEDVVKSPREILGLEWQKAVSFTVLALCWSTEGCSVISGKLDGIPVSRRTTAQGPARHWLSSPVFYQTPLCCHISARMTACYS